MSETSEQIFAEASKLSMVVNPGQSPQSNVPAETTRSPSAIETDYMTINDIVNRYEAACIAEHGKCPPLDAGPWWALHYKRAHFGQEHYWAVEKGNP
jgi:hypothetical protein